MNIKSIEIQEATVASASGVNDTPRYRVDFSVKYESAEERQNGVTELYWDGKWLGHFVPKLNTDNFVAAVPIDTKEVQFVFRYKGSPTQVFTYKITANTQVIRKVTYEAVLVE